MPGRFSEPDHVASIIAVLKLSTNSDIELERKAITTRRRKDIVLRQAERIVLIIEVKRPGAFRSELQRARASQQVIDYAADAVCNLVAWTDGTTIYYLDLNIPGSVPEKRELLTASTIIMLRGGETTTTYRFGLTNEDYWSYPEKQRTLVRSSTIQQALHVPVRPVSFDLDVILASPYTIHIVTGESDIGKTELSYDIASDARWDAIRLDGRNLTRGIVHRLEEENREIFGQAVGAIDLLQRSAILRQDRMPFGIVIDGFDDWMAQRRDVLDLPHIARILRDLNCKIIVTSRPMFVSLLVRNPDLSALVAPGDHIYLTELSDEDLDRLIAAYFRRWRVGGTLHGRARDLCKVAAWLAIVSEAYEDAPAVDREITRQVVFQRYLQHKLGKLEVRYGGSQDVWLTDLKEVANTMRTLEMFDLPTARIVSFLGRSRVDQLHDEGILESVQSGYTRFRYPQVRNFLLARDVQLGVRPIEDILLIEGDDHG